MAYTLNNVEIKSYVLKGTTVKKYYLNNNLVFSAGNIVTYYVDSDVSYSEEVESGNSCLSPTTFTPVKSGWTFVGWREDNTASSTVLSSKAMDSDPISLYAVFKKDITANFYSGSDGTLQQSTATSYYNNGSYSSARGK